MTHSMFDLKGKNAFVLIKIDLKNYKSLIDLY